MEHIYSVEIELSKTEYEGLKGFQKRLNEAFYEGDERSLPWVVHRLMMIGLTTCVEAAKMEEALEDSDPEEDKHNLLIRRLIERKQS